MMKSIVFSIFLLSVSACADNEQTEPHQDESNAQTALDPMPVNTSLGTSPGESDSLQEATVQASEILEFRHSNLLALSRDEAAWLDRHGYPTPEELEDLASYDLDALESAMRNRHDPKAAALVGHRKLLEGDIDGASSAFAAGAAFGSLYARQQMALTNAQSITGLSREDLDQADQGNLQVMVAQLEVARLLGDHRAQDYINKHAATLNWKHYGKHVLAQTAEFMRQYGEGARARGQRVVGPDPRPNADAWSRLSSDPHATVTVYRRGGGEP